MQAVIKECNVLLNKHAKMNLASQTLTRIMS